MYIYTKKAEKKAKELGLEPRKAGTVAMYGSVPLSGMIGKAWEKKGYVYEVKQSDRRTVTKNDPDHA